MNLFSAAQLTDSGCRVILDADSCSVQDRRTQALVGAGPRHRESEGLWEVDWLRVPSAATTYASTCSFCLLFCVLPAVASSTWSHLWLSLVLISTSRHLRVCLW